MLFPETKRDSEAMPDVTVAMPEPSCCSAVGVEKAFARLVGWYAIFVAITGPIQTMIMIMLTRTDVLDGVTASAIYAVSMTVCNILLSGIELWWVGVLCQICVVFVMFMNVGGTGAIAAVFGSMIVELLITLKAHAPLYWTTTMSVEDRIAAADSTVLADVVVARPSLDPNDPVLQNGGVKPASNQ